MNRRELLTIGGALAAFFIVGCEAKKPAPNVSSLIPSSSERLQEFKAYINERKNILIPGFYKWLQEVQPNMPLTLDETMRAFILIDSFREWESTTGRDPTVDWIGVGVFEPKVRINVEKFSKPQDKVSNRRVDASLIQGAALLLTRKVNQPNHSLIVDRNGKNVKATDVFVKGFAMYGYVGQDKVSEYNKLDLAAATVMVFQYLFDLYKGNVILDESDLPAYHLLWSAKLNNDLKTRNIVDPKLFRYWHIESDLGRLAGAFGGASDLASPPQQEAIDRGLSYFKREYGN